MKAVEMWLKDVEFWETKHRNKGAIMNAIGLVTV